LLVTAPSDLNLQLLLLLLLTIPQPYADIDDNDKTNANINILAAIVIVVIMRPKMTTCLFTLHIQQHATNLYLYSSLLFSLSGFLFFLDGRQANDDLHDDSQKKVMLKRDSNLNP
jgi:hypothetical protein